MFDPLWRIDVENGYRGAGDRRRANQRWTIPMEVLRPYERSRIKKRCQFTGHRIVPCMFDPLDALHWAQARHRFSNEV
jgi:hypothetical protein